MFLLVSVHGVSIQISINLGKTFLRISRIRDILLTWILARNLVYLPPLISQIPDLNGFDFYFDLFWIAWHWKPAILGEQIKCIVQAIRCWQNHTNLYTLFRTDSHTIIPSLGQRGQKPYPVHPSPYRPYNRVPPSPPPPTGLKLVAEHSFAGGQR